MHQEVVEEIERATEPELVTETASPQSHPLTKPRGRIRPGAPPKPFRDDRATPSLSAGDYSSPAPVLLN